jgi:phosphatidylserine decarboxylase
MVGKIVNNIKDTFTKGEEKGYFKLGGSTIVILLKENELILDKDIINNSKNDIETQVKYRETIGAKK